MQLPLSRRRLGYVFTALVVAVVLVPLASVSADASGYGLNRVQTAAEDSSTTTGYGPGWVGLSYKRNGPIVGYLFAKGFRFTNGAVKGSADHMDIRGTRSGAAGHPKITRWPWGYAHGAFNGCAYGYGTSKFAIERSSYATDKCAAGPHAGPNGNWWHSETVFCTDSNADPLCSPVGVWSKGKPAGNGGPKAVTSKDGGCLAYGNIGASAAYGNGAPVLRHPLGKVPPHQKMALRYVTKDRQYIMAKWNAGSLAAGIEWAFFPRSCVK
jgi:hypothetical protein